MVDFLRAGTSVRHRLREGFRISFLVGPPLLREPTSRGNASIHDTLVMHTHRDSIST
jgi:hypothetical protein